MGKGTRQRPTQTFAVMQQSYEDPEAGDKPKPVLVPVSTRTRRPIQMKKIQFGEDLEDDSHLRANMRMLDDEDEEGIFDDEVEEDFDNEFIKQMLTGEGVEEEAIQELDDDEYPVHEERRPIEKAFERMMDDFDDDEDLEEEDPRVRGPLNVEDYAPALEEFMREHAGGSHISEEAPHHRGLLNQLKGMALEHGVFDSTRDGKFVTTLDSDKSKRINSYFHEDKEELKRLTLEGVRNGTIETRDVLAIEDEEEVRVALKIPVKPKDRMDCETVLTTYSNVFNHPNVIAASTKKIRLNLNAAKQATKQSKAKHADPTETAGKKSPAAGPAVPSVGGPTKIVASSSKLVVPGARTADEEEDLFADLPDEALPTLMDLSVRPKDETKEEKQMRRAIVKELQRERRSQKKGTKEAYKEAGIVQAALSTKQKNDKAMVSLSVVRRV